MPERRGREQRDSSSWLPRGRAAICFAHCSIRTPRFSATTRSTIPRASFTHSITATGRLDLGTIEERDQAPLAFLEKLWSRNPRPSVRRLQDDARAKRACPGQRAARPGRPQNRPQSPEPDQDLCLDLIAERSGQWEVYSEADLRRAQAEGRAERRRIAQANRGERSVLRRDRRRDAASTSNALAVAYEELGESGRAHSRLLAALGVK